MSRRERIVSIALSENCGCLPLLLVVRSFQDLMTEGDIHRVKEPLLHRDCSYPFQLVTLYFFLYFGLRLLLCSSFISDPIVNIESNMLNYLCTNAPIWKMPSWEEPQESVFMPIQIETAWTFALSIV